jgi:heat shock protein HslJ
MTEIPPNDGESGPDAAASGDLVDQLASYGEWLELDMGTALLAPADRSSAGESSEPDVATNRAPVAGLEPNPSDSTTTVHELRAPDPSDAKKHRVLLVAAAMIVVVAAIGGAFALINRDEVAEIGAGFAYIDGDPTSLGQIAEREWFLSAYEIGGVDYVPLEPWPVFASVEDQTFAVVVCTSAGGTVVAGPDGAFAIEPGGGGPEPSCGEAVDEEANRVQTGLFEVERAEFVNDKLVLRSLEIGTRFEFVPDQPEVAAAGPLVGTTWELASFVYGQPPFDFDGELDTDSVWNGELVELRFTETGELLAGVDGCRPYGATVTLGASNPGDTVGDIGVGDLTGGDDACVEERLGDQTAQFLDALRNVAGWQLLTAPGEEFDPNAVRVLGLLYNDPERGPSTLAATERTGVVFLGEGEWDLAEITVNGTTTEPIGELEASFRGRSFGVETGCNGIGGQFHTNATGGFAIAEQFSTAAACLEPGVMDQENRISEALSAATMAERDGDTLILRNADASASLVLTFDPNPTRNQVPDAPLRTPTPTG